MKRGTKVEDRFLIAVGKRIQHLRKDKRLTLAELSEDIGTDKSNTHRLEHGKNFTLHTLIKIAAFLGVHPKELLEVDFELDLEELEQGIQAKKASRRKPSTAKKSA
jgi:transcriptional regulator with XRE-family HTH domain